MKHRAAELIRTMTPARFLLETLALLVMLACWSFAPLALMLAKALITGEN